MRTFFQQGLGRPLRRTLDTLDAKILETSGGANLDLPPLGDRQRWIELLLIFLAVLFYCFPFLELTSQNPLRGNESPVFQSLDQFLIVGLQQAGHFPLWNPYIYSGIPYAADPMLHAYNPFISIPVLLLGEQAGFKIAVFLGFLIGALGMWWLARLMRIGAIGRLWMALLYAFSGGAMSRFFQGQYLLQIATGWLPWIIAGLYAALVTRQRKYIAVAALSLALLFLCGNAYYAYYSLYVVAILAIILLARVSLRPVQVRFDVPSVKVLLATGILAVGLIAAQLLPLAGFWGQLVKETDRTLSGSQTMQQVFLDFTSKESNRPDAIATLPREEFYAYIGIVPLLMLLLLPLGWHKGSRRMLIFFVLLALFAVLWIDVRQMPWKGLFENVAFLYQFRYPTRMLIFSTLALAALSGLAIDGLVTRLDSSAAALAPNATRLVPIGAKYLFAAFLLATVVSVAAAHRGELASEKYYPAPDTVLGWLKQQDSSIYYIAAPNGWHHAVMQNQLRYLNAWYPFHDAREIDGRMNTRNVDAAPKYEIIGNDAPAPQGSVLVKRFDQHTIYLHPDSLSFAFTVPTTTLTTNAPDGAPVKQSDTATVPVYTPDTDSIEAIVSGQPDQMLVVLSTLVPGWTLSIDNHAEPILSVSGYMATAVLPGTHRYLFTYRPAAVSVGWLISLLTLLVTLTLAAADVQVNWQAARERIRSTDWTGWLKRERVARPRPSPTPVPAAVPTPAPRPQPARRPLAQNASVLDYLRYQLQSPSYWMKQRRRVPKPQIPVEQVVDHIAWRVSWPDALFIAAIVIYLIAVLYRNADFPIYFFTDEAVHMNEVADLLAHGFRNSQNEFLPTYFNIGTMFGLNSLSVYLQIIPYLLFGKSVAVTRGVSGVITALGGVAASLTLRNVLKIRHYWLGILLLIASPAWFLHSRTAFENAELAAWYAVFIYCYLMYRSGKTGYLLPAILAGAAVFYTHGLGQVLIGVVGLALLIVDFRFHFRRENRRVLALAVVLLLLVAAPYIRYQLAHPEVTGGQIAQRGSYLVDNSLSLIQKIGRFGYEYFHSLSPLYWYLPNNYDLVRHVMKGYGHIWIAALPFALFGLYIALRNICDPKYRVLLIALLATPIPTAIVALGVLRDIWFVVPAALVAAVGLAAVFKWLEKKWRPAMMVAPALAFVVLAGYSLHMLSDALTNGPTWYQDYSLYGLQYGGRQVFQDAILRGLESDPNIQYVVSPNWANGTDQLMFFFIPPEYENRVRFGTVDDFMNSRQDLTPDTVLVTIPDEYQRVKASALFSNVDVMKTLPYPNGQPGFYLLHLRYSANADAAFAQIAAEQRQPVQGTVTVQGDPATITYSRIEAGQPGDMFDGNFQTLVRGVEANPFVVDLVLQKPLQMSSLSADFGHMSLKITVSLYQEEETTPLQFDATQMNPSGDPHVDLSFGSSYAVAHVHIEVTNLDVGVGNPAKIHIRNLKFNP